MKGGKENMVGQLVIASYLLFKYTSFQILLQNEAVFFLVSVFMAHLWSRLYVDSRPNCTVNSVRENGDLGWK